MTAFLVLLGVHWFADFVLQTHWQASNKSKNNVALAEHVITYTAMIGIAVPAIFQVVDWRAAEFVAVNGVLHFATDYVTSRISSRLFMAQFDSVGIMVGQRAETRLAMKNGFNPPWFFVVIGADQLIHQVTLALTMKVFFGWN